MDTVGNHSDNVVTSPGGGNNTVVGTNGNGMVSQNGTGNGNIINDQLNLNLGNQAVAESLALDGARSQQDQELLLTQGTQQSTGSQQTTTGPRPLSTLVKRVKDAVDRTLGVKPKDANSGAQQQPDNPNPQGSG